MNFFLREFNSILALRIFFFNGNRHFLDGRINGDKTCKFYGLNYKNERWKYQLNNLKNVICILA